MYVGVDEAGKGPVLGPMVTAAVRAPPDSLPDTIDDSKRVRPERREAIAAALRDRDDVTLAVTFVEPAEIDRPDTDMNTLTVCGQARVVRAVATPGDRVVADACDTDDARFGRRLAEAVRDPESAESSIGGAARGATGVDVGSVEAAHGADATDPVVGAASIVAKVARDARMKAIADAFPDYDGVGSGYPSDPTTREFLRAYVADHGDVPPPARRSWSTCADVLAAAEQSGLSEF